MADQPDPLTGMTVAMPGSDAGDAQWRAAMAEKARLLRSMQQRERR
jgi:hypothetical protein